MASSLLYHTSRASRVLRALSSSSDSLSKIFSATLVSSSPSGLGRAIHTTSTAGSWHVHMKYAGSSGKVPPSGLLNELMIDLRTSPSRRWLSSSPWRGGSEKEGGKETHAERRKRRREEQNAAASLATIEEEEFSAITDRIPQRPMTAVESTSYSLVILAALGFAAAVLYAAFSELIFSPKEYTCFSKTLKKIEDDPRVTIRLGTPMKAYGTESKNRSARQRIPHRIYQDDQGREHVQLQFVAKGPSGRATVHADMYEDGEAAGGWRYHYLYLTVESPLAQQVVLVKPYQVGDNEAV